MYIICVLLLTKILVNIWAFVFSLNAQEIEILGSNFPQAAKQGSFIHISSYGVPDL